MTRLELDVDFKYKTGMVGLRFFERDQDGDRFPLRVQRLYNLAVRAKREPKELDADFRDLLIKLAPEFAKPAVIAKNLQLLAIPRSVWDRLRTHPAVVKTTVREHGSRAIVSAKTPKAPLFFELTCHGEKTLFSAVLDTPSGPIQWSKACNDLRQRRLTGRHGGIVIEAELNGTLYELDLPVTIDSLNQLFRHDNQRVNTTAITDSLPVLINHRLDRVRGPSVTHRQEKTLPILSLSSDGAQIIVAAYAKRVRLDFDTPGGTMGLTREKELFTVIDYRCRHYDTLRKFFAQLGATPCEKGYQLPGTTDAVARLSIGLETLPSDIDVRKSGDLTYLTGKPATIQTVLSTRDRGGWFEFEIDCQVADTHVALEDLRRAASSGSGVMRTRDGFWLKLDGGELDSLNRTASALDSGGKGLGLQAEFTSTIDTLKGLPNMQFHASAKQLAETVRRESADRSVVIDDALTEPLRIYQRQGVEFLCSRSAWGVGPLLADDMGLGKTLQVLTALVAMKSNGIFDGAVLIVCPASVLFVWEREAETFFPTLKVALLTGTPNDRKRRLKKGEFDLAVCSYAVLRNDLDQINAASFDGVVLDEAQVIRNPTAMVTQAAWSLTIKRRLALTGTPLENRLTDLWSIMTFLNPGYLGTQTEFESRYNHGHRQELVSKLKPLLLRRRKGEVATDLPPRTEEVIKIAFEPEQAQAYSEQLAIARSGGRGTMQMLASLTRLRQACCHPKLIDDVFPHAVAKLKLLREMVEELVAEGHSILVFSQFTSMLDIIKEKLGQWGISQLMLTGKTSGPERKRLVDAFNQSETPRVFLLSLKAAGTGLTLTKADYVIIFDPWWNPAAENQAIDRTHRIGQKNPVIAYRFIMAGSVEEKVLDLQAEKMALFQDVVDGVDVADTSLTADDLASLLE